MPRNKEIPDEIPDEIPEYEILDETTEYKVPENDILPDPPRPRINQEFIVDKRIVAPVTPGKVQGIDIQVFGELPGALELCWALNSKKKDPQVRVLQYDGDGLYHPREVEDQSRKRAEPMPHRKINVWLVGEEGCEIPREYLGERVPVVPMAPHFLDPKGCTNRDLLGCVLLHELKVTDGRVMKTNFNTDSLNELDLDDLCRLSMDWSMAISASPWFF